MATTNRAYVFDLAPGQSFVEFMLKRGYDIYVIDWNPPQSDESRLGFEDYILDFIPSCVAEVQSRSGEDEVSVIGYCMGGVLALDVCGAAYARSGAQSRLLHHALQLA